MEVKQILSREQTLVKVNEIGQQWMFGIIKDETEYFNAINELTSKYQVSQQAIKKARREALDYFRKLRAQKRSDIVKGVRIRIEEISVRKVPVIVAAPIFVAER